MMVDVEKNFKFVLIFDVFCWKHKMKIKKNSFLVVFLILFTTGVLRSEPVIGDSSDILWWKWQNSGSNLVFHPNGYLLSVGRGNNYVDVFDVRGAGTFIKEYGPGFSAGYFLGEGERLLLKGKTGYEMWDFTNDIRILSKDLEFDILEVSSKKSEIAVSYCSEASELPRKQNMIEIFDVETSEFKKGKYNILKFSGYGSQYLFPPYITQMKFSADGTRLAFVIQTDYEWPNWYDWIYYSMVWNLVTDSIEYKTHGGRPIAISHDGTRLAFASSKPYGGGGLDVINLETKEFIGSIPGYFDYATSTLFTPNGRYLIYSNGYSKEGFSIWELTTQQTVYIYPKGTWSYFAVSNDGKYLAGMLNSNKLVVFLFESILQKISTVTESFPPGVVYPNPSKNIIQLKFSLKNAQRTKISILDLNGNIVRLVEDKFLFEGEHLYTIDVYGLVTGTYTLLVQGNNVLIAERIVVLH